MIGMCLLEEKNNNKKILDFFKKKYKISSDYWKNLPLLKLFDYVKVVRNIDISNLEPTTIK